MLWCSIFGDAFKKRDNFCFRETVQHPTRDVILRQDQRISRVVKHGPLTEHAGVGLPADQLPDVDVAIIAVDPLIGGRNREGWPLQKLQIYVVSADQSTSDVVTGIQAPRIQQDGV